MPGFSLEGFADDIFAAKTKVLQRSFVFIPEWKLPIFRSNALVSRGVRPNLQA